MKFAKKIKSRVSLPCEIKRITATSFNCWKVFIEKRRKCCYSPFGYIDDIVSVNIFTHRNLKRILKENDQLVLVRDDSLNYLEEAVYTIDEINGESWSIFFR